MEKMKDFQWARILIKTKNEDLSSTLDIVVEEACYSLSLSLVGDKARDEEGINGQSIEWKIQR